MRIVNMPKGKKAKANDYMTKEQSMRVVEELHNMRKDLNIWMPSFARTLGCSNYNITQLHHRVKHGSLVRGVFRYRIKKAKKDIAIIRPEFIKKTCLLYTSPSPRDRQKSRMPSSA